MSGFFPGYGPVLAEEDQRLAEAFGKRTLANGTASQSPSSRGAQNGNGTTSWRTMAPARDTLIAERIILAYRSHPDIFERALRSEEPVQVIRRAAAGAGLPFITVMYGVPAQIAPLFSCSNTYELAGLLAMGDVEERAVRAILDYNRSQYLRAPGYQKGIVGDEARMNFFQRFTLRQDGYEILRAGCSMEQVIALNEHPSPDVRSGKVLRDAAAHAVPIAFTVAAIALGADDVAIIVDAYKSGVSLEILGAYFFADGAPGQ